jgi:phenylalanyl-tRNA synthetase alpha subunit
MGIKEAEDAVRDAAYQLQLAGWDLDMKNQELLIAKHAAYKELNGNAKQEMTREQLQDEIFRHRNGNASIRGEQASARQEVKTLREWAKNGNYKSRVELVADRRAAEIRLAIANADARIVDELVAGAKRELEYWDYMELEVAVDSLIAIVDELRDAKRFVIRGMSGTYYYLRRDFFDKSFTEPERREAAHRLLRAHGVGIVMRDFEREVTIIREVGTSAVSEGAL